MNAENHILSHIESLADRAIAEQSQRFFKTGPGEYGEGDQFLGVRVPDLRKLARQYREESLHTFEKCLQSPLHEARMFALICLVNRYQSKHSLQQAEIYKLYVHNRDRINNWDLVDCSAPPIVGAHLYKRNRKPLYQWAKSKRLWDRRIAIMASLFFVKQGDFKDTLGLAQLLLNDQEDLIHKAVGWMLREIGKRSLATEERFLKPHYHRMPRVMLRYAIEKFPEKKRQQYMQGNIQD